MHTFIFYFLLFFMSLASCFALMLLPLSQHNNISIKKFNFCLINLGFIILFAFSLYLVVGNHKYIEAYYKNNNVQKSEKNKNVRKLSYDIKKKLYKLEYKVANDSKDFDTLWDLANLYLTLKDYNKAENAFKKSLELKPDNFDIIYHYIVSSSKSNDGVMPEYAHDLSLKFLKKYQNNPSINNLLAIHYFKKEQYESAIKCWNKVLESNDSLEVKKMITLAQDKKMLLK